MKVKFFSINSIIFSSYFNNSLYNKSFFTIFTLIKLERDECITCYTPSRAIDKFGISSKLIKLSQLTISNSFNTMVIWLKQDYSLSRNYLKNLSVMFIRASNIHYVQGKQILSNIWVYWQQLWFYRREAISRTFSLMNFIHVFSTFFPTKEDEVKAL